MQRLERDFEAVAFAGGGNRCYWQGGFWTALTAARPQHPRFVVGVSGGAFQACIALLGASAQVRTRVMAACADNRSGVDWRRILQGRSPFIVGDLYRALLVEIFGPQELSALKQAPEIFLQISHAPPFMPPAIAALAGIAAYQAEKLATGAAYSQAGRFIGLKPSWISTHETADVLALIDALMATSSVPPFMPVGRVKGRATLDGGLVDNPPLQLLRPVESAGGRTLVLTTRSGKPLPPTPQRTVVRPSQPLTVGKFSVTDAAGIAAAYTLGLQDGDTFAKTLR